MTPPRIFGYVLARLWLGTVIAGCELPSAPPVQHPTASPSILQLPAPSSRARPPAEPAVAVQADATAPPAHAPAAISPPAAVPPSSDLRAPRSERLPSGFYNPMPGGVFAGYQADTGLDLAGTRRPVYALASGTLDYSEPGHTLWTAPSDTANCVRYELDAPIAYGSRTITHVYYAHLASLVTLQHEGDPNRKHIEGGEMLGVSGIANGSPHLHIGLLLDGEVNQYLGTFLRADAIREVLGGYRNGNTLPKGPTLDIARGSQRGPHGQK